MFINFIWRKKMKKTVLFAAVASLFFGSALVAETNADELTSGYNSPGRIDVKGSWDLFITAKYLYWQPKEEGLEFARLGLADGADFSRIRTLYEMDFDYKSGFKAGIGTNFNYDNWTAYLEYTRLHTKDHSNTGAIDPSDSSIYPFWLEDFAISASTSWRLRYDILDLTLDRAFYSGMNLSLDAFYGLRGGCINQKYHFEYLSLTDYDLDNAYNTYSGTAKTNSWVVGPLGGISLKYLLGAGFRLFGDVAGSLLYQRLQTSLKAPTSIAAAREYGFSPVNETETYNQITPNINFVTGLRWGTYFDNNNWHFDISAAYEFQYYWAQNRMKKLANISTMSTSGRAKDLMLQGLTITGKFDF
jgi:hypothetical protein